MTRTSPVAARLLTKRDAEILRWVGSCGVASLDQLARQFWSGRQNGTAQDRLDLLVHADYLQAQWSQHRGAVERVYALAASGCAQLPCVAQERVRIGFPPSGMMRQQLLASEARLQITTAVEAAGGQTLDWKPEWELRAEYNRAVALADRRGTARPHHELADAQVVYRSGAGQERTIDIEIDGYYYGAMLQQKAACYGRSKRTIYWICEANRMTRVRAACAAYPNIQVWGIG